METSNLRLLLGVLSILGSAESCPASTEYTAESQLQLITYSNSYGYVTKECSYWISPGLGYEAGYFLELKWPTFYIPDDMPNCKENYIEVFLTR